MKFLVLALTGAITASLFGTASAQPQGAPQGSYLSSCTDAHIQGDALVATCRTMNRREQRSSLAGFRRCAGDIGNNNGVLQCNLTGGGQARGTVLASPGPRVPQPGSAEPRGPVPPPAYGYPEGERRYGEPGYGERQYEPGYRGPRYEGPGYGERNYGDPGYAAEWRERCFRWHHEAERLRDRLDVTNDPYERARMETRLREIHEREERCRY